MIIFLYFFLIFNLINDFIIILYIKYMFNKIVLIYRLAQSGLLIIIEVIHIFIFLKRDPGPKK